MYIVPIAWLYVALMMAVAEATNPTGTILGAIITFVLYGLVPISLILYFMTSGARRKARQAREAAQSASLTPPDTGSVSATNAIPPEREKS